MSGLTLAVILGFVFVTTVVLSMFGQGGGSVLVPLLLVFGIGFHDATTTSLFVLTIAGLSSLWVFARSKTVDWKLALVIDPITDILAFVSGYYATEFDSSLLKVVFAVVMVISSYFMIRQPRIQEKTSEGRRRFGFWHRTFGEYDYDVNLLAAFPICAIMGVLAGLLGISCGILKVPLLVLLCGVPIRVAVATSSFMVTLTGLGGFFGHSLSQSIDWKLVILTAVVAFVAAQVGPRLSLKIDKRLLQRLFGGLLILIALWMVYNAVKG